jgi:uncharacterized protein YkwD
MKYSIRIVLSVALVLSVAGCDLNSFFGGRETSLSAQPQVAQDFVRLVNEHRVERGLSALEWHPDVTAAALDHSQDMQQRGFFSHNDPDGNTPWDRLQARGVTYTGAAENIARGQTTGDQVLQDWLESEDHRTNIENGNYTHHGLGYVEEGNYWTHKFVRM